MRMCMPLPCRPRCRQAPQNHSQLPMFRAVMSDSVAETPALSAGDISQSPSRAQPRATRAWCATMFSLPRSSPARRVSCSVPAVLFQ